jgi:hypothetical protein
VKHLELAIFVLDHLEEDELKSVMLRDYATFHTNSVVRIISDAAYFIAEL